LPEFEIPAIIGGVLYELGKPEEAMGRKMVVPAWVTLVPDALKLVKKIVDLLPGILPAAGKDSEVDKKVIELGKLIEGLKGSLDSIEKSLSEAQEEMRAINEAGRRQAYLSCAAIGFSVTALLLAVIL